MLFGLKEVLSSSYCIETDEYSVDSIDYSKSILKLRIPRFLLAYNIIDMTKIWS